MTQKPPVNYIEPKMFFRKVLVQKNRYNWHKKHGTLADFKHDDKVIEYFMILSRRVATRYNFSRYSYIDDMISEGIMNCYLYWHNFNPDKYTNVFAYFTTIVSQAFVRYIKKEKKQTVIKEEIIKNILLDPEATVGHKDFFNRYLED